MFKITCVLVPFVFSWSLAEYGSYSHEGSIGNVAKILSYENQNEGLGSYRFAFETSDGIQRQEQGELTNANSENEVLVVRGAYSYTGPDGIVYTVRYTADENGFHPEGDHIKVPPYTPWDKSQQSEDNNGYYTQGGYAQKLVTNVYLPGGQQRPSYSQPQPIYGSSNTPKPIIAKYTPIRQRTYISRKPVVISTTSRPQSFSTLSEVAYAPTRRNAAKDENNTGFQSTGLANSILEILSASDVENDKKSTVKVEDINSL